MCAQARVSPQRSGEFLQLSGEVGVEMRVGVVRRARQVIFGRGGGHVVGKAGVAGVRQRKLSVYR